MKDEWEISLLKLMFLSRYADLRESILVRQGKGHIHISCSGHEGLMALPYQLSKQDFLYPYYRGCHLMIAKKMKLMTIARDFFAKQSSSSQGRSVYVHAHSNELNIFPGVALTASQCLPAVGTAWGQKLKKEKSITVCSIGDGATREGDFYEAICLAFELKLPIIFLIEDNHYAISTPTKKMSPFHLNIFDKGKYIKVQGADVFQVYETSKQAIETVRAGLGPVILWCEVDRLHSHTAGDDQSHYRSEPELKAMKDPISNFINQLIKLKKITKIEVQKIEKEIVENVSAIFTEAEEEKDPSPKQIKKYIYGPAINPMPISDNSLKNETTIVEAINFVFHEGLKLFPNLFFFGEDIEDPKGGVFGMTRGLSTKFPKRVCNAPVAESTIVGSAVGLSVVGIKPVFEIQFVDFLPVAFNQLVTQIASLRWRSAGAWKCPLILYAPYGAYLPAGGIWHSQSNDGWWTHIPGLSVAIPSNPQDVIDIFWYAFQAEDPFLVLIPKHLFRKKMKLDNKSLTIPFNKVNVIKEGNNVTIICWGNTVELVEKAVSIAEQKNISVEIIDLKVLIPTDWATIKKSLAKTGRLVLVQEDNKTSGFANAIISEIVSNTLSFEYLFSAPQIVARDDVHIPFHPLLEEAVLPNVNSIVEAIEATFK